MDKRNNESSAAVKAAAWAWYQHGSCGKSPTESEFAAKRSIRAHGPSRFKRQLVIIRVPSSCEDLDKKTTVTESNPSNTSVVGRSSSDLLDAYEIKRISSQIDLLTGSNSSTAGKILDTNSNMGGIRRVVSSPGSGLQRKKTETKFLGLKIRHGVICGGGSRNDVVEPTAFNRGRLRLEKHEGYVSRSRQQ